MEEKQQPAPTHYHAELCTWDFPKRGDEPNEFDIHQAAPAHRHVATVTLNADGIDADDLQHVAILMAAAPELWRMLRELLPRIPYWEGGRAMGEFTRALDLLTTTCNRMPVGWIEPDEAEEAILLRGMAEAQRQADELQRIVDAAAVDGNTVKTITKRTAKARARK
ncbi:MAG TPA: hypothetical protein VF624_01345 [Tepidisphaeraceae bacterium]|jgi:hypothetical protein